MNEIITSSSALTPLPAPNVAINIRVATVNDLPFLDGLQKQNNKALGYFPTKQFEGYIAMGGVLVAEERMAVASLAGTAGCVGYCISRDRYLKRDELGVIYQLCVTPGDQRKLVGAALVKAVFERSAYGCRLYCCWCAQDLAANYFWESLGFVPIAFRTGSMKKGKKGFRVQGSGEGSEVRVQGSGNGPLPSSLNPEPRTLNPRVHIFWQKRIRAGDEQTPWWFPSKTDQGSMRADRLVLPIPPGMHWREAMPVILPAAGAVEQEEPKVKAVVKKLAGASGPPQPLRNRALFGAPRRTPEQVQASPVQKQIVKAPPPKIKCDPRLIAAARELRDRWMEEVNAGRYLPETNGKYAVSRLIEAPNEARPTLLLPAA